MPKGILSIKLRPTRIAILVDPNDEESVLKAIELNSFLWGGQYNPIIPTMQRISKDWKEEELYKVTAKKLLKNYLDIYDPDFIVKIGKCKQYDIEIGDRKCMDYDQIRREIQEEGLPNCGIGFYEVFDNLYKSEFKFKRQFPLTIELYKFTKKHKIFLSSIFGLLPKTAIEYLTGNFKNTDILVEKECSINDYVQSFKDDKLSVRKISRHLLEVIPSRFGTENNILLMDPRNPSDVIKYWNLRALGRTIFPIPLEGIDSSAIQKESKKFINNFFKYHINNFPMQVGILNTRNISEKDRDKFIKNLKLSNSKKGHSKICISNYPRLSTDHWVYDHIGIPDVLHKVEEKDITDFDSVSFKALTPEFCDKYGPRSSGTGRFVNELSIRIYEDDILFAEVLPNNEKLLRNIKNPSLVLNEWRISRNNLVYYPPYTSWKTRMPILRAEEVFLAWLRSQGISAKLSPCGLLATEALKTLGGINFTGIFREKPMYELLTKITSGKPIHKDNLVSEVKKINNSLYMPRRKAESIIKTLIDSNIIDLGIQVQCKSCSRRPWYKIDELKQSVQCYYCLSNNNIPKHDTREITWSYRSVGPFGLGKDTTSTYALLLSLRFFKSTLDKASTPILSFEFKKQDHAPIEIDAGLLIRDSYPAPTSETQLVFIESKGGNALFNQDDIDRMGYIANQFPGSILVFSTPRMEIEEEEIEILKKITIKGRSYYQRNRSTNPVLILTGNELFSLHSLTQSWERLSPEHKKCANHIYGNDIHAICEATQQIYLGMESQHDTWRRQWAKNKKRKK